MVAWGSTNSHGTLLTTLPDGLTNVVQVVAAYDAALALRADGTVVGWGEGVATNVPAGLSNVSKLWGDRFKALALLSNGTVVAWAAQYATAFTNVPIGLSNVVDVAGDIYGGCALRSDGSIVTWGGPLPGSLAGFTNVSRLYTGLSDGGIAVIGRDGKLFWPDQPPPYGPPPGLSNLVSVAGQSPYYFVALAIEPQITSLEMTNQQAAIRFPTFFGQQFTVEHSPNLSSDSWTNLTTIAGTGYEAVITDTNASGTARYYRLRRL
jgi:hypothetical protein